MLLIEASGVVEGGLVGWEVSPDSTVVFVGGLGAVGGVVGIATAESFVFGSETSRADLRRVSVADKGRVEFPLRLVMTFGSVALVQNAAKRRAMDNIEW
jgi:hypothetical protein